MSLLRATVRKSGDWWEAKLLDLNIVADGDSEEAMLLDLEHTLVAEYHLALKYGQTPFMSVLLSCPPEATEAWENNDKRLRTLNLPNEVRQALSAVFHRPNISDFTLDTSARAA